MPTTQPHPWISKSGRPYTARVRSPACARCGATPDAPVHLRAALTAAAPAPAGASGDVAEAVDEVVREFEALPDTLRAIVERAGVVFDKWPPADIPSGGWTPERLAALDPEVRWQGIAFTMYTDWVIGPLSHAIDELKEVRLRAVPATPLEPRWHHSPDAPPEHFCEDCDELRRAAGLDVDVLTRAVVSTVDTTTRRRILPYLDNIAAEYARLQARPTDTEPSGEP